MCIYPIDRPSLSFFCACYQLALDKYRNCAISKNPLHPPVVACELGNLYNKDSLIQYLLGKHKSHQYEHIRSLKDVIACTLYRPKSRSDKASDDYFACPVTDAPGNGKYRFVVMRHCGCVLSERALKEVPSRNCLGCQNPIPEEDSSLGEAYVFLYPVSPEELDSMREKMEKRRARLKAKKKSSKLEEKIDVALTSSTITSNSDEKVVVAPTNSADSAEPMAVASSLRSGHEEQTSERSEEKNSVSARKRKEVKEYRDSKVIWVICTHLHAIDDACWLSRLPARRRSQARRLMLHRRLATLWLPTV